MFKIYLNNISYIDDYYIFNVLKVWCVSKNLNEASFYQVIGIKLIYFFFTMFSVLLSY